jgi:hypothetical protein
VAEWRKRGEAAKKHMRADKARGKTKGRSVTRNLIEVFRELNPENQAALLEYTRAVYGEKKAGQKRKGEKHE